MTLAPRVSKSAYLAGEAAIITLRRIEVLRLSLGSPILRADLFAKNGAAAGKMHGNNRVDDDLVGATTLRARYLSATTAMLCSI